MRNESQRAAIQQAADELKALPREAFRRLIRDHRPGWIARWIEETSDKGNERT